MSEYETFYDIMKGSRSDAAVMITTFLLTVLFDLTVAIEAGMIMAAFLFMRKMIQISNVSVLLEEGGREGDDPNAVSKYKLPPGVEVFELNGPLFFGAAYKFKDSMRLIEKKPKVLIMRMRNVPVIDATGLHTMKDVLRICNRDRIRLVVSGLQPQVYEQFEKSRLLFKIGKRFIVPEFEQAVSLSYELVKESDISL